MQYLAPILPYATLMTVLTGVIFGVLSVRQWQRTRYLTIAAELVQTLQGYEFTRSIERILELPERAEASIVFADREMVSAAYVVGHVFEGLGMLVFYHLLPLHLVDRLVGGYLRASWARLERYVAQRRVVLGPSFAEWFQWLAERVGEHAVPGKQLGAAKAHREWR